MLRSFLLILFSIITVNARSQYLIGADAGISIPVVLNLIGNANDESLISREGIAPIISVYLQPIREKRFTCGLSATIEHYSINLIGEYGSHYYTFNDDHQSTYLYLAPLLDWKLGKNKRLLHFYFLPAIGFFIAGRDNGYNGSSFNDSKNITKIVNQIGFRFKREIQIKDRNLINISWGYSFMFGTLTNVFSEYQIKPLHPGVFSLGIGYMREFRKKTAVVTTSTTP